MSPTKNAQPAAAMEPAALFSVMSKCFAPVDDADWTEITRFAVWSSFLEGSRRALQGEDALAPAECRPGRCPLEDFLSAGEVEALFAPPTPEEKSAFAARRFTGGLPGSALPVESLYSSWSRDEGTVFGRQKGLYMGESAQYMRDLLGRMGFEVPAEYAACPDHLALELDLLSVMLRSGMVEQARQFLSERFEWLTAYRMRLLDVGEEARFWVGIVDVLMGLAAQQASGSAR